MLGIGGFTEIPYGGKAIGKENLFPLDSKLAGGGLLARRVFYCHAANGDAKAGAGK